MLYETGEKSNVGSKKFETAAQLRPSGVAHTHLDVI